MTDDVRTNVGPDQQEQAHDLASAHAHRVAERARQMQQSINDAQAGPPGTGTHEPGEAHDYDLRCKVCGQAGTIRVSVDPALA